MGSLYFEVAKRLKAHGCYFVRSAKGDHEWWYSPITRANFPVDRGITSRHTANQVMKQAGIPYKF